MRQITSRWLRVGSARLLPALFVEPMHVPPMYSMVCVQSESDHKHVLHHVPLSDMYGVALANKSVVACECAISKL